ncbi:hypothetical protein CO046_01195 [Candidatus Peregrinibacteria bacterium CG_4_9_14_0_2_um_filter_53_11]|nr:MAG: hypothetical protein CO046_01195 [Candidatus Peregrinibacteria bacterium CG_4_9_14_0_2_um_filter_53_11]
MGKPQESTSAAPEPRNEGLDDQLNQAFQAVENQPTNAPERSAEETPDDALAKAAEAARLADSRLSGLAEDKGEAKGILEKPEARLAQALADLNLAQQQGVDPEQQAKRVAELFPGVAKQLPAFAQITAVRAEELGGNHSIVIDYRMPSDAEGVNAGALAQPRSVNVSSSGAVISINHPGMEDAVGEKSDN